MKKSLIALAICLIGTAQASSLRNEGHVTGKAFSSSEVSGIGSAYSKSAGTSNVTSLGNYQLASSGVGISFSGNVTSTVDAYSFNVSTGGGTGKATYDGAIKAAFSVGVTAADPYGHLEGGGAIDYGISTRGAQVTLNSSKNKGIGALGTANLSIEGSGSYGGTNTSITGTANTTQTSITAVNTYGVTVDGVMLPTAAATSVSEGVSQAWVSFVDPR